MLNNVCCCFVLFVLCVFVYVGLFRGFWVGFLLVWLFFLLIKNKT